MKMDSVLISCLAVWGTLDYEMASQDEGVRDPSSKYHTKPLKMLAYRLGSSKRAGYFFFNGVMSSSSNFDP